MALDRFNGENPGQPMSGMTAYLADQEGAMERSQRGALLCECEAGALVDTRDEELECLRCGKALWSSGRRAPGVGRVAA